MNYIKWNNKIAEYFFNPEKAGTRVWFSVEQELINKIAQDNNVDPNNFIENLKKGPNWITRSGQTTCGKASAVFKKWRDNKEGSFEYPPYIAYLALFVLAVNHGDSDDFSTNNYYGRLNTIVNEHISTTHFKSTLELWDNLQDWSLKDKN